MTVIVLRALLVFVIPPMASLIVMGVPVLVAHSGGVRPYLIGQS
jgi:hypothetical protein